MVLPCALELSSVRKKRNAVCVWDMGGGVAANQTTAKMLLLLSVRYVPASFSYVLLYWRLLRVALLVYFMVHQRKKQTKNYFL
jgi:hypothetical protein